MTSVFTRMFNAFLLGNKPINSRGDRIELSNPKSVERAHLQTARLPQTGTSKPALCEYLNQAWDSCIHLVPCLGQLASPANTDMLVWFSTGFESGPQLVI